MATSGGAGCTTARWSMDSVHGRKACLRGRAAVSSVLGRSSSVLKRRAVADKLQTLQSGSRVRQRPWGVPAVTSSLERCAGQLLYHQRGKLRWRRRRHRALLTPFITGTATATLSLSRTQTRASPCGCCRAHVRSAALPSPRSIPSGARGSRGGGAVLAPFRGREPSSGTPSGGTSFRPPVAPQVPSGGFCLGGLPKRWAWPLAVS